jgi:2-keto-4-pentenoate hydratase/2-oxohepta-3-ene-1,7-dioic acid hydratase in catechol pathway
MRLCTFSVDGEKRLGASSDGETVIDVPAAASEMGLNPPAHDGLRELFEAGGSALDAVREVVAAASESNGAAWRHVSSDVTFHYPFRPRKNVVKAGGNSRTLGGVVKDAPGVELPPGRWQRGYPVRYHTKSPTAVLDPGQPVTWPVPTVQQVYAEPQLVIIIGEEIHFASPEEALARVAGYAVATDVSSHDLKLKHGQWPKAVSLDSFFPWGPFVVTADEIADPDALDVTLTLNDELVVSGSTGEALLSVGAMLAEISTGILLERGDVLMLGAPEWVGFGQDPMRWLTAGDVIVSKIDGVGSLTNPVAPYQLQ